MYNTRHGRGGMRMQMPSQQTNFVPAGQFKTTEPVPLIQIQSQQQTPLKSIMKQPKPEPITPKNEVNDGNDKSKEIQNAETAEDGHFKKQSTISKKERRERRNKRIGKLVRPKNALMVLNELCGGPNLRFEDSGMLNGEYEVTVHIGVQIFKGLGSSKNAAKQKAAEAAIKNYISGKVKFNPNLAKDETPMETDEADDVSWCHLASFALYKLMDSWQGEGDFVPPETLAKTNNKMSQAKPAKQLPENAASMHPLMLLHQMRPGVVIEDFSSEGTPPNIIFTVKLTIDGQIVYGAGPSKKVAKKNCAKTAMHQLYGIEYPPEESK